VSGGRGNAYSIGLLGNLCSSLKGVKVDEAKNMGRRRGASPHFTR